MGISPPPAKSCLMAFARCWAHLVARPCVYFSISNTSATRSDDARQRRAKISVYQQIRRQQCGHRAPKLSKMEGLLVRGPAVIESPWVGQRLTTRPTGNSATGHQQTAPFLSRQLAKTSASRKITDRLTV